MSIGNRVFLKRPMPSQELLDGFAGIPAANIADTMGRSCAMNPRIRLMSGARGTMVGPALTVKARAGDNLFIHQALDISQPGDIIVVDGASGNNRSLAGEIMMRFAQNKGIAGIVVDGCLRDLDGIQQLTMPVYAAGVTPQGPWKFGPGEVNTPIACGGQVVFPGDILVGDRDGIVVVRRQDAEEVADTAIRKKADEDKTFALMKSDLAAYAERHISTTQKRFQGREPEYIDANYADRYQG